jgi:hypothetical protein
MISLDPHFLAFLQMAMAFKLERFAQKQRPAFCRPLL